MTFNFDTNLINIGDSTNECCFKFNVKGLTPSDVNTGGGGEVEILPDLRERIHRAYGSSSNISGSFLINDCNITPTSCVEVSGGCNRSSAGWITASKNRNYFQVPFSHAINNVSGFSWYNSRLSWSYSSSTGSTHTFKLDASTGTKADCYCDGTLVGSITTTAYAPLPWGQLLIGYGNGSDDFFHWVKVYNPDGTILKELYPALDDNGSISLWDRISKKFYYPTSTNGLTISNTKITL